MRRFGLACSLALVLILAGIPALAQSRGGGRGAGMSRGGPMGGPHMAGPDMGAPRGNVPAGHKTEPGREVPGKKTPDEMLAHNTRLSSRLQGLLPAGEKVQDAAKGFKNLGQFVAAVHVSHNLNVPFGRLKSKMIGPSAESLGKAIHELKPEVDSKAEAKKAEKEAHQDMEPNS